MPFRSLAWSPLAPCPPHPFYPMSTLSIPSTLSTHVHPCPSQSSDYQGVLWSKLELVWVNCCYRVCVYWTHLNDIFAYLLAKTIAKTMIWIYCILTNPNFLRIFLWEKPSLQNTFFSSVPVFQVVRFPNDPCEISAGAKNGTCYTA